VRAPHHRSITRRAGTKLSQLPSSVDKVFGTVGRLPGRRRSLTTPGVEADLRAHERDRRAVPSRYRVRRWVISVPDGSICAVVRSDEVSHPVVGEVKGMADVPIPDHLAWTRRRVGALPRAPMVRSKGVVGLSDSSGKSQSRGRQSSDQQSPRNDPLRIVGDVHVVAFRRRWAERNAERLIIS
jgi:hypothetical protein